VPDKVAVMRLEMGLLARELLIGKDGEAGMKTIEDDTVMLVTL